MQDHSHRLLFLAATGLMCAVTVYGSQAGPGLLLPDSSSAMTAQFDEPIKGSSSARLSQAISFQTLQSSDQTEDTTTANEKGERSTASVVPNDASCPAANAAALVSPPSVNSVIGSPTPIEKTALPRQGLTGTALGTGSSCPPRHDVQTPNLPSTAADSLNSKDGNALSPGAPGP